MSPVVPGFAVERLLGSGAAGAVYLAREAGGLRRPVALKLFALEARAAFDRELEALVRVEELRRRGRDAALVQSLASGTYEGGAFIAFEYAEGGSLKDLVDRDGRLPPARAVALAVEAARALERLHAEGLSHRDVKPANLLLGADGGLRLGDFGIAHALDLTVTAAGSPAFAAPEVLAGRRDADGRRVDVYGLGATLYFLLVGEAMLPGCPDVFALERAGAPRAVQDTILDATAPAPAERLPDAATLAARLERALALPAEIAEKPRTSARRADAPVENGTEVSPHEEDDAVDELAMWTKPGSGAVAGRVHAAGARGAEESGAAHLALYASTALAGAGVFAVVAWLWLPQARQMYMEMNLELPLPTKLYLSYAWHHVAALVLLVPLYPLVRRLGSAKSLALPIVAVGLSALFVVLSNFLPIMRLVEGIK